MLILSSIEVKMEKEMVLVDTSKVAGQSYVQNNGDASSSAASSSKSSWMGRSVGILPKAILAVAVLSLLATGANAYGYPAGAWIEEVCDHRLFSTTCWYEQCYIERICDVWGWCQDFKTCIQL